MRCIHSEHKLASAAQRREPVMRMKVLALAIVGGCALTTLADAQAPDATDKPMGSMLPVFIR